MEWSGVGRGCGCYQRGASRRMGSSSFDNSPGSNMAFGGCLEAVLPRPPPNGPRPRWAPAAPPVRRRARLAALGFGPAPAGPLAFSTRNLSQTAGGSIP